MMEMPEYHAVFSIDTSFFNRLDGMYTVEGYVLKPCLLTERNQHTGCSNFILEFDFYGLDEKDVDNSERVRRSFVNMNKGAQIAKEFVAWFVLATRDWARLSSQSQGHAMRFGPCTHHPVEEFDENILETAFHIDKKAKEGEFFKVQRPHFSFDKLAKEFQTLKLPSDFLLLTKKMFSLERKERKKFLNACFSYQFALENWISYPTVSLLSLVSAVESMMVDEYTSGFCEDGNRLCPLKKDVMKRFKTFFERNLQYPLPRELRDFLNMVYSKRSLYVHEALLGEGEARGIQFGLISEEVRQLNDEQRYLERLVNAALMEWLKRI